MIDSYIPTWVALMTYPNAERQVARHLQEDLSLEYYLPMIHNRDRRFKRNNLIEKAMFPSYLFAKITARQVYDVRRVSGLFQIVSSRDNGIIPVPQSDIDAVRLFEATEHKFYIQETAKLVKGAHATILEGEFAGMQGNLLKNCKEGNFCVSIDSTYVSFVMKVKRADLLPTD